MCCTARHRLRAHQPTCLLHQLEDGVSHPAAVQGPYALLISVAEGGNAADVQILSHHWAVQPSIQQVNLNT